MFIYSGDLALYTFNFDCSLPHRITRDVAVALRYMLRVRCMDSICPHVLRHSIPRKATVDDLIPEVVQ